MWAAYQKRLNRFKFSNDKDCLPPDANYVREYGDDEAALRHCVEELERQGYNVCVDLPDWFYETPGRSKEDIIKELGITDTFDYALPQEWVNIVRQYLPTELKDQIVPSFVWLYDKEAKLFGRPCSISFTGNEILAHIALRPQLFCGARYYSRPEVLEKILDQEVKGNESQ